jgi:hypothetical protein
MAGEKYRIETIVELKGCSIDEFILLASQKGISLPEGGESSLSLAEIRVIDPTLAYQLRYKKPERQNAVIETTKEENDKSTDSPTQSVHTTLYSFDSLGQPANEVSESIDSDPDFLKKNAVLQEIIRMADYADLMTIDDVHALRKKWEDCGLLRGKLYRPLYKKYELSLKILYSNLKIDESVKATEYQAHLNTKSKICDDLEAVPADASIDQVSEALEVLTLHWRDAGPVEDGDKEQISERFKKAKEVLNKRVQVEGKKSTKPLQKKKESNISNRSHIGIIKFYDSYKGFGFVATNSFGTDNSDSNRLVEVYINSTGLKGSFEPDDRDWIVFNIEKNIRDRSPRAINAKELESSKDDLLLALNYIGEFAKIKGRDNKGEKVYNEDVLPYVYRTYWCKDNKPGEFLGIIIEQIGLQSSENQASYIKRLLSNDATCSIIESLLQKESDSIPSSPIIDALKEAVISSAFEGDSPNWTRITELSKGGLDISPYYSSLLSNLTSGTTLSLDKKNFLLNLGYTRTRALVRSGNLAELPEFFLSELFSGYRDTFASFFEPGDSLSDKGLVYWFLADNDFNHILEIGDWDLMVPWIEREGASIVTPIIQGFVENVDLETDEVFQRFSTSVFMTVMKGMDEDEKIQFLQQLPEKLATEIAVKHFAGTEVFDTIIGEQWKAVKAGISYVTFDLESDGESIREFAFKQEENTRVYQGEEQLNSLLRALKKKDVIVGHKIKDWDLKILEKKGLQTDSFVWDTLEIEILLNPCRYAYSLHTLHDAKSDTELADKLFWNQLFRLSQQPDLCESLSSLLPPSINDILSQLQKPYFEKLFNESALGNEQLFQELSEISPELQSQLTAIDSDSGVGNVLIVSPRTLWGKLAQYISLSFIDQTDSIEFKVLSKEKLSTTPINDTFLQTILGRFLELSKTPVIANIAQYLRFNHFSDELLSNYMCRPKNSLPKND